MKILKLEIISEPIRIPGLLPMRIRLGICDGEFPIVTHAEVNKGGYWTRSGGVYFDDLSEGLANFYARIHELETKGGDPVVDPSRAARHCGDDY